MGTYDDFSKLKHLKPSTSGQVTARKTTIQSEDRVLTESSNSTDYFSALLGSDKKQVKSSAPAKSHRTTIVTPATITRVREELAEDAREAERAAFRAREAELQEELEAQIAASESLAVDLANLREELEACRVDCEGFEDENHRLAAELEAERAKPPRTIVDSSALEEANCEIARLKALLAKAQGEICANIQSPLLDAPAIFSEKFAGEVREHVIETLATACDAADASGRERRARILEAVLCANPPSGELERRRITLKQIIKNAGSSLDNEALLELEKIGFRYVSGNKHHKLEWAGIRFPLAKTPSDYRACLNSAAEISNRVF